VARGLFAQGLRSLDTFQMPTVLTAPWLQKPWADADQTSEHMLADKTGSNPSGEPMACRRVLKADTSWHTFKPRSKSPECPRQNNRSNRGRKLITKRRQQWVAKTCESEVADKATPAHGGWSRTELAEKRKEKSALWDGAVKRAEAQFFNLTAHDSDDDEADFFPEEAHQLDDPPIFDWCGDDNALRQAADEPLAANLDKDLLPQRVTPAVDVPPFQECMKQAGEGPLVAPSDLLSMPVAAA